MRLLFLLLPAALLPAQDLINPILPLTKDPAPDESFEWRPALAQSMRAMMVQHGFRLAVQPGTRRQLGGKFLPDYADSLKATHGWGDGDNIFINYVNHPIQGGVYGYIYVTNHPKMRRLEFSNTREYWTSRLKALAWSTALSTQFEVGPLSEASIGNVGKRKGSAGYVDLVITPTGGFALMVAEDWIDKRFIQRWEVNAKGGGKRALIRMALNPSRTLANLLQGKGPWHREGRSLLCTPKAACP